MNAATAVAAPAVQHAPSTESSMGSSRAVARVSAASARQTPVRSIRSEWIKLRTLRSTWVTAVITLFMTTGIGTLATVISSKPEYFGSNSWKTAIIGTTLGQVVVAVLGALVITGEYSSGQIRSSLAAVPHRWRLFWAKSLSIALWSFLAGAFSVLLTWVISAPFMGDKAPSFGDARVWGLVWGSGLGFATISLMALGLGFLMRSTAGATTVVLTLLFVIDIPLQIAGSQWHWAEVLSRHTPLVTSPALADPFNIAQRYSEGAPTHTMAIVTFVIWAVVPLLAGWITFSKRDA